MSQELKAQRARKKMNQKYVAEYLGISLTTYAAKERGEYEFTLTEIKKLLELFDKKFEEIF